MAIRLARNWKLESMICIFVDWDIDVGLRPGSEAVEW